MSDSSISFIARKLGIHFWYIFFGPIFFLIFAGAYKPSMVTHFLSMGQELFDYNLINVFLLITGCILIFRTLFYLLRKEMHMNWWYYSLWCFGELFVSSLVVSLYFYFNYDGIRYAILLGRSAGMVYSILVYPYLIISLGLKVYSDKKYYSRRAEADSVIRFTDENKKLKLAISSATVLYIQAEENYVRIHYLDGDAQKEYLLRNTMRGIDELVSKHGLSRSHRSYYVNSSHIEVLRRNRDGNFYAQLDVPGTEIPISRKYYEMISKTL